MDDASSKTRKKALLKERDALLETRTYRFSDTSIQLPGTDTYTGYSNRDELLGELETFYVLRVFANGLRRGHEGYVSVVFYSRYTDVPCAGQLIISVIDASGKQRFSKTFRFSDNENIEGICIQYIAREELLSEPDELLPNDVLTLLIDVYVTHKYTPIIDLKISCREAIAKSFGSLDTLYDDEQYSMELYLDSPVGIRLAAESNFLILAENRMIEENTNTIPVTANEFKFFIYVGKILMGYSPLKFESIKDLFDLCIFAAVKYDIPNVVAICQWILKSFLSKNDKEQKLSECHEILNRYEEERLYNFISKLIDVVACGSRRIIWESNGVDVTRPIPGREWFYRRTPSSLIFEIDETGDDSVMNTFDFYN